MRICKCPNALHFFGHGAVKRTLLSRKIQGPLVAGPGVKGGHCSDARSVLSR